MFSFASPVIVAEPASQGLRRHPTASRLRPHVDRNDAGDVPVLRRLEVHHHVASFGLTVCTYRREKVPNSEFSC
jgi:hypothetical protein